MTSKTFNAESGPPENGKAATPLTDATANCFPKQLYAPAIYQNPVSNSTVRNRQVSRLRRLHGLSEAWANTVADLAWGSA